MIPFRVFVRLQVVKGRKAIWKSEDVTMVTIDGNQSQTRAIGAALSLLGLIAAIRKMPLNRWLERPKPKPIKKAKRKSK